MHACACVCVCDVVGRVVAVGHLDRLLDTYPMLFDLPATTSQPHSTAQVLPPSLSTHAPTLFNAHLCRLIDFGFAKKLRSSERTFTLVGTPQYLAPEIVASSGHGMAVDWWGFGVLVYELLTGSPPFNGTTMVIYQKIIAGESATKSATLRLIPHCSFFW